ncbi:hypothetical protein VTJ83DRAFT_3691 [Remersonia thermophila]|uniref:Uncharacterized protein n=1 Tax=Remersonia thermophila TaxID=72144 RepID=A0ABR4DFB4_9PEZI
MVSFFGLRVGGKKKKPDDKAAPPGKQQQQQQQQQQQWKRIDQNALGEGQFFGKNIHRQPDPETGSIRSVSRAAAAAQGGRPYVHQDTHNLGAVSMIDLSTSATAPGRPGTSGSITLRPHASEANMRARFGANNGSSASLALPAPGFGARLAARNGSVTSLAFPTPGFGSRPGTPSRTKPWVNPLDVHFARPVPTGAPAGAAAVPAGPATPKSPPTDSPRLPPTPGTENAEARSVFGEEADDMVTAVMASVKKKEEEEEEREAELEKQRETARLEMERLERQKSTESSLSARRPSAPTLLPEPEPEPEPSFDIPPALLKAAVESNAANRSSPPEPGSGSRGGPPPPHALHQGPPPTGPPTQSLPQPPGQNPPRQGPLGPARPYASYHGANRPEASSSPKGASQKVFRPYRPPPLQGCGPLGPLPDGLRSPSPTLKGPGLAVMAQSPALPQSPTLHSPPLMEHHRPVVVSPEPETPRSRGPGTPAPEKQEPAPLLASLTSPSTLTSPSGSIRRLSFDDEPASARPIIQNVRAKRDTLALNAMRTRSLSMRIEELEKTLLRAQITSDPADSSSGPTQEATRGGDRDADRSSTDGSVCSAGPKIPLDEEDDDDGPILSIPPAPAPAPAPLRVPHHPPMPPAPPAVSSPPSRPPSRPQSPMRGPPRRGPMPRRPGLDEYGVSAIQVARGRGTPTSGSRSGSTDNYSVHSSPPSRTASPQIRQQASWRRDLSQPSPAPTLDHASEQGRSKPALDTGGLGFNFDFGPGPNLSMAPPTPDSTTWSLASPVAGGGDAASAAAPPTSDPSPKPADEPARFTRANVPPPLNIDLTKFNFDPDAPSRDPAHGGLWTPQIRSVPWAASATDEGRPSTSSGAPGPGSFGLGGHGDKKGGAGGKLAASPRLVSKFPESEAAAAADQDGSFMGIGMARGPSIRELRRPKTSGGSGPRRPGPGPAMVDSFGTTFI